MSYNILINVGELTLYVTNLTSIVPVRTLAKVGVKYQSNNQYTGRKCSFV